MALRTFGANVRLPDLKGSLIGLRYLGEREFTSTPEWNQGKEITQSVPRVSVIEFVQAKDKTVSVKRLGESLVFQKAIANDIRGVSDWTVGVLEQIERPTESAPDATMFELSPPEIDVALLDAALTAAGL